MNENVSKNTNDLVKSWIQAKESNVRAKTVQNLAELRVETAANELGKFLTLENADVGEVFNIWYGNGLLQVKKLHNSYEVRWRTEPTGKQLMEQGS